MAGQQETDTAFRDWLVRRSWALSVRYCRVVAVLLPPASLAADMPLWREEEDILVWLVAWQCTAQAVCLGVLSIDRWRPAWRGSERLLAGFSTLFITLCVWIGMVDGHVRGDWSIWAAGMTFGAGVIATPRRIRQPLYALSLAALAVPVWLREDGDPVGIVAGLVNPFCVVVLCLLLDRFSYSRDLALWRETCRADAERARADAVLHNALPPPVAELLKREQPVPARKVENLGVLFADIAGFTRYARDLPPDAVLLVLDALFREFDACVQAHGVEKIKTIGDGYMAVSEAGVAPLCRLALDLRAILDRYNQANGTRLSMRIGVHAGPAVRGVLGTTRLLYDVWGDTVNVAARLEQASEAGRIQVSDTVVQQAGSAFAFGARGLIDLPGRGRVATWWLLGTTPARSAVQACDGVRTASSHGPCLTRIKPGTGLSVASWVHR